MADTGVVDWRGCEAFFTGRDAGREDVYSLAVSVPEC